MSVVDTSPPRRPMLAVGCFAASIFLFEILLTRLFSVILFHHFAFVAISVGMLGLASAGVRIALAPTRFTTETAAADIRGAALRFAGTGVIAVAILVQVGLSANYTWLRAVAILFIYIVACVPFYFGGLAISLLLTHYRKDFAKLYAIDLLAAGTSGLLVAPSLTTFGGPSALLVALVLAVVGGVVGFPSNAPGDRKMALGVAGLIGLALVGDQAVGLLRVRRPKEADQGTVLYEAWNALSRVAVYDLPMKPWSVGPNYRGPVPAGLQMDIDASAATPILHGMSGPDVEYLHDELTAAAYSASSKSRALVIGAGGGRDVLSALLSGMKEVDAVEINSIIVEQVMQKRYLEFSGGLYNDPRVHVHLGDGRSFVRGAHDRYDVIQASLVDTWAATAAGAFALSENNLYTQEAMTEYIAHLNDDGILTLVRWVGPDVYRLAIMLHAAARSVGISDPGRHIAILTTPHTPDPSTTVANVLFRRSAFDPATVAKLEAKAESAGFGWAHHPLRTVPGRTAEIAGAADPLAEAARTEDYELRPSTDDWPFFFYRPRPNFFGAIVESPRRLYTEGPYLLVEILAFAGVLGFFCLLLPMWRKDRTALSIKPRSSILAGCYFVGIGVGFMFIEVSMMQRFVLFLGHPTYALTAVIVALLGGAGIGSAIAGRLRAREGSTPFGVFAGLAATVVIIVSASLQPAVFAVAQQQPFVAKVLITQVLVAPLGLFLGTLMPFGIGRLTGVAPALVPWAWGLNGFASVVGSCLAALLSMTVGFSTTFYLAAACYVAAAAAAAVAFRATEETVTASAADESAAE